MPDYIAEDETWLLPWQVRGLKAEVKAANSLADALREAISMFRYTSDDSRARVMCTVCNRLLLPDGAHAEWCQVGRWERLLAEYDALKGG